MSFAERVLKKLKLEMDPEKSNYVDTRFLVANFNFCERMFSITSYALNNLRKAPLLINIEIQEFLYVNDFLWHFSEVQDILQ